MTLPSLFFQLMCLFFQRDTITITFFVFIDQICLTRYLFLKITSGSIFSGLILGPVIKRFKIIAERYRNRRKRFCLRFNLIAGICNFER